MRTCIHACRHKCVNAQVHTFSEKDSPSISKGRYGEFCDPEALSGKSGGLCGSPSGPVGGSGPRHENCLREPLWVFPKMEDPKIDPNIL